MSKNHCHVLKIRHKFISFKPKTKNIQKQRCSWENGIRNTPAFCCCTNHFHPAPSETLLSPGKSWINQHGKSMQWNAYLVQLSISMYDHWHWPSIGLFVFFHFVLYHHSNRNKSNVSLFHPFSVFVVVVQPKSYLQQIKRKHSLLKCQVTFLQ